MQSKTLPLKRFLVAGSIALLPLTLHAEPGMESAPPHCSHMSPHLPPQGEMGPGPEFMKENGPPPFFLRNIALTDAQSDAVFNIMHAQAPAMRDKMKAVRNAREALMALTFSGQYEETAAKKLADSLADNIAALSLLHAASDARIYALLTPEQRKQIEEDKKHLGPHPASFRNTGAHSPMHTL